MILAKKYNNPGNLSWPIHGYEGPGMAVQVHNEQGPHYAAFPSHDDGVKALHVRLASYIGRGYDTILKLNHIYASDMHWHDGVSKFSNIPASEHLNPANSAQMTALAFGIVQQETGDAAFFGMHPYPATDVADNEEKFTWPT